MDILIETTRISYRTNKYQIGCFLENMKRNVKRESLEWGDFVLQEQLKSLMYVDLLLREDLKKDKLIDELNFNNCMRLKRKKKIKLFVGIT